MQRSKNKGKGTRKKCMKYPPCFVSIPGVSPAGHGRPVACHGWVSRFRHLSSSSSTPGRHLPVIDGYLPPQSPKTRPPGTFTQERARHCLSPSFIHVPSAQSTSTKRRKGVCGRMTSILICRFMGWGPWPFCSAMYPQFNLHFHFACPSS